MFQKLQEMEEAKLKFNELMELTDRLESKLRKIETMADAALSKASVSHSLIVVRKIAENRVEDLSKLLD